MVVMRFSSRIYGVSSPCVAEVEGGCDLGDWGAWWFGVGWFGGGGGGVGGVHCGGGGECRKWWCMFVLVILGKVQDERKAVYGC